MNPEIIINLCGELLNKWRREENETCCFYVRDGKIVCGSLCTAPSDLPHCLKIGVWLQEHGLTAAQWEKLGGELFNQYTKELSCRPRRKP